MTEEPDPAVAAKARHPFVYGLISGFAAALAVVLTILAITGHILEIPRTIDLHPATPEASQTSQTLRPDRLRGIFEGIVGQVLIGRQKSDGSIQAVAMDREWPSHAWTTAQVIAGLLSGPDDVIRKHKDAVLRAARYVADSRNPAGFGWQKYPGIGPSVLEPTVWSTVMFSRLSRREGIFSVGEIGWIRMQAEAAIQDVLSYNDPITGAFHTVSTHDETEPYTYSGVMGLFGILEARSAGITPAEDYQEIVQKIIQWLSNQIIQDSERCRFRASPVDENPSSAPFGLTAQVLYSLQAANAAGFAHAAGRCEEVVLDELLHGQLDPLAEGPFAMMSVTSGYAKEIRTLWLPWTLLWVIQERNVNTNPRSSDLDYLWSLLLQEDRITRLVDSFPHDDTWRMGESLLALGRALEEMK